MADYERFSMDISEYLNSKLPTTNKATVMEVSEYISNRTMRFVSEMLIERDREWKRSLNSQSRHYEAELKRLRKYSTRD